MNEEDKIHINSFKFYDRDELEELTKEYYLENKQLKEEKQELIDYLNEKMNNIEIELIMKSQNDYELGKLQGYYKSCKETLSKIEKE